VHHPSCIPCPLCVCACVRACVYVCMCVFLGVSNIRDEVNFRDHFWYNLGICVFVPICENKTAAVWARTGPVVSQIKDCREDCMLTLFYG